MKSVYSTATVEWSFDETSLIGIIIVSCSFFFFFFFAVFFFYFLFFYCFCLGWGIHSTSKELWKSKKKTPLSWLVGFYCISTFVGYLIPNPFFQIISSISNNSVQLIKTVSFWTIYFSMSTYLKCKYTLRQEDFYFKLFSLVKQFHFKQFKIA